MTSGYLAELQARAPAGVPTTAIAALNSPNALVSQEALQQLSELMAQVPNGSALMSALLEAARVGLASGIQRGFLLTLGAMVLALGCCLLVWKIRLTEGLAQPSHP